MKGSDIIDSMVGHTPVRVEFGLDNAFNPETKRITLLPILLYNQDSKSLAIVAHECAHSQQNLKLWLKLILSLEIGLVGVIVLLALAMFFQSVSVFWVAIGLLLLILTTHRIVKIIFEIDASRKAYRFLKASKQVNMKIVRKVLKDALLTYLFP